MISMMSIIISVLLLIVSLACLFYFVKSLIAISKESMVMAIVAFFLSPFVHIFWYITKKNQMSSEQKMTFVRFFISFALMFILSIIYVALMSQAVDTAVVAQ